jgi:hypothetical protein
MNVNEPKYKTKPNQRESLNMEVRPRGAVLA